MNKPSGLLALVLLLGLGTAVPVAASAAEVTPFQLDAAIGYGSGPNDFDAGFGFTVGGGYTLSSIDRNLQARAEMGLYTFSRDFLGTSLGFTRIPFALGARYSIPVADRLKLFGQAALEVSFDDFDVFDVFGKHSRSEVNLGVTPSAGVDFELNRELSLFAAAGVHLISDSYFSMQFGTAYHF